MLTGRRDPTDAKLTIDYINEISVSFKPLSDRRECTQKGNRFPTDFRI